MKNSSSTTEQAAVHYIHGLILKNGTKLSSAITVNDKGVSFDGHINVFKSPAFKAADYLGMVPVQVKGKSVKKISPFQATFPVKLVDLKNYYSEGGVIYFVCELLGDQSRVYAKILLPLDLKPIIDKYGQQKSTNIKLKPVTTNSQLESLCTYFLQEKNRQPVNYVGKYSLASHSFEQVKATSLSVEAQAKKNSLLGQEMYLYGVTSDIEVPISKVKFKELIHGGITDVDMGGTVIPYEYQIVNTEKYSSIILENILSFTFLPNNPKVTIKLEKFYKLSSLIKALLILKNMQQKKPVSLREFNFHLDNITWDKKTFVDIDSEMKSLEKIVIIYDEVGISHDFLSRGPLFDYAPVMCDLFINADYRLMNKKEVTSGMVRLNFGDDYLMAFYSPSDQEKLRSVASKSFAEKKIELVLEDTEERFRVSPFLLAKPIDLLDAANVTLSIIQETFSPSAHVYNDATFIGTNLFCLDSIKAFDITGNENYLHLAKSITLNMLDNDLSEVNHSITKINHLQVITRLEGSLRENEQQNIIKIKEDKINNDIRFLRLCCNILLQSRGEAKYYFDQLNDSEKKEFIEFPIYTLYKQILNTT
ncbi:hypothetical protein ACQKDD_15695 [Planococcus kocurii]|uniref:hypothetical protein n=1 Tax=Planococcus kocurii TaxID=1374 RepID=UPI003D012F03